MVTQTVVQPAFSRPAQTITTVVTLGPSPTGGADSGDHGSKGLTNLQLGAIIGSIAILVVIGITTGICMSGGKKKPAEPVHEYYTTISPSSSSSSSSRHSKKHRSKKHPRRPPPVAERIPGGPKYPTYRAIPIPNPREPPPVARTKV
ncbi:hypothetical protein QQS21_000571 [Conoideocrella luteorostrata]|uniref:Uncharacterized protein n=1 Tax=Conoideocrella luteorostrata TaxID=1105319 RepID=A0AAJ0CYQ2_9HYPO|nr:hypothetical protein QQS21_000571 [Conoideocrella luteorostrata]